MAHLKITPETDFDGCPSAPVIFLEVLTYRNCCKAFRCNFHLTCVVVAVGI